MRPVRPHRPDPEPAVGAAAVECDPVSVRSERGAELARRKDVSCVSFEPSASIDQMLPFRENAIVEPSGDQSGRSSIRIPIVRRRRSVPFARIVQMSSSAARSLVNAIRSPSGDHSGNASKPTVFVSRVWFEPSASITHTSWNASAASDVYAIFDPSGDHVGHVSWEPGENVSRVGSVPSARIVQISQLANSL
jgi:hypothetical protein